MSKSFTNSRRDKILELEMFLQKHQYFSNDCLPGVADALMFSIFDRQRPDRQKYPSLFHWYGNIKPFTPEARKSWKITSQQDEIYQEIVASFEEYYLEKKISSNHSEGGQIQTTSTHNLEGNGSQWEYIMNIRFKENEKQSMNCLKKKISQQTEIVKCEIMNDDMRLNFRCETHKLEEVKNLVSKYHMVITFQIKKDKTKKFPRSRTFANQ